jgi:hypothetical protein
MGYYNGVNNSINSLVLDKSNNVLYFGGNFNSKTMINNSLAVQGITWYNKFTNTLVQTNNLTQSSIIKTNGNIFATAFDFSRNLLYIGGDFTTVNDPYNGTINANRLAVFNTATNRFNNLSTNNSNGVDATVNAIVIDESNNLLYVGGKFVSSSYTIDSTITSLVVNNIAAFDISNKFQDFLITMQFHLFYNQIQHLHLHHQLQLFVSLKNLQVLLFV